jgi:hypothetical protein
MEYSTALSSADDEEEVRNKRELRGGSIWQVKRANHNQFL